MKLGEEVLTLRRKVNGPEHPDTLMAMQNVARSYNAAGRRDDAWKLQEQVLTLRRKVLGPEHPETLRAMTFLADYASTWEEGLKPRAEVLRLNRKVLGPEHPYTLWAMHDLAFCLFGIGRKDEALKLQEEVVPLFRKVLGPEHPDTLNSMKSLAASYFAAGRRDEAFAFLGVTSARNPRDTRLAMKLAALQVWFGKQADYLATCRRMLQWAADQEGPDPADRAAKITNLQMAPEPQMLQAALALARRAVESGGASPLLPWYKMGLGMAEFRNGNYPEADRMLSSAAASASPALGEQSEAQIKITCKFYRVMSLFRQGKAAEARQLFAETEAAMKPLPADENNPLANGADHDDLILWLAYKEAKALLNAPRESKQ